MDGGGRFDVRVGVEVEVRQPSISSGTLWLSPVGWWSGVRYAMATNRMSIQ
jgi:hypothetical protein